MGHLAPPGPKAAILARVEGSDGHHYRIVQGGAAGAWVLRVDDRGQPVEWNGPFDMPPEQLVDELRGWTQPSLFDTREMT